jgi:hypothetical protein
MAHGCLLGLREPGKARVREISRGAPRLGRFHQWWKFQPSSLSAARIGRLLTAVPITPGGIGIVEVAYIGGLILAGEGHATVPADVFHAQVAAAVLEFRALTFGIQIRLGALTHLIWRTNTSRRRPRRS